MYRYCWFVFIIKTVLLSNHYYVNQINAQIIKKYIFLPVSVVDGETLTITKVSRLHMGAYLCIASNGVPPSISKRIMLMVQCKYFNN